MYFISFYYIQNFECLLTMKIIYLMNSIPTDYFNGGLYSNNTNYRFNTSPVSITYWLVKCTGFCLNSS